MAASYTHDALELPARLAAVAADTDGQVHGRGVDRDGAVHDAARQVEHVARLEQQVGPWRRQLVGEELGRLARRGRGRVGPASEAIDQPPSFCWAVSSSRCQDVRSFLGVALGQW